MLYKEVTFKNIAARNLISAEYISKINDTPTPLGGKINTGALQTPLVRNSISSSINPHTIKPNIETKFPYKQIAIILVVGVIAVIVVDEIQKHIRKKKLEIR